MKRFEVDCSSILTPAQFWDTYLAVAQPEGAHLFGRNLDAFSDALSGGPGYPGECELSLVNSSALGRLGDGKFLLALQEIADEPGNEAVTILFR